MNRVPYNHGAGGWKPQTGVLAGGAFSEVSVVGGPSHHVALCFGFPGGLGVSCLKMHRSACAVDAWGESVFLPLL